MAPRAGQVAPTIAALAASLSLTACDGFVDDIGHHAYGYVDGRGELVIPATFLAAGPFYEGRAAVAVGTGWGFIDREGHWVVEPVLTAAGNFSEGLAAARDAEWRWGFIDGDGDWAIPPQFAYVCPFLGGQAYVLTFEKKALLLDHQGRATSERPDDPLPMPTCLLDPAQGVDSPPAIETPTWEFLVLDWDERDKPDLRSSGLLPALPSEGDVELVGFADFHGRWVIEPEFQLAYPFVDGLALVEADDKYGFVDRAGRVAVPPEYKHTLQRFSRGRTIAATDDGTWLIDTQGNRLAELEYQTSLDQIAVFLGYGDFFAEGLLPWHRDGKWGYIDTDGKWAIQPQYDFAHPFEHGRASVRKDGKGYLIDPANRVVATAALDWIGPSDGTLARTGTLTQWGFLDQSGNVPKSLPYATTRIEYYGEVFTRTRPPYFSEGFAVVARRAPHRWTLLDAKGRKLASAQGEWIKPAGPGRFAFMSDQRWGLLGADLQPLAAARFDSAKQPSFVESATHAYAMLDDESVCIDLKGRVSPTVDGPGGPCNPTARYYIGAEGKGVEALDGSWRIPAVYEYVNDMRSEQETDLYYYLKKGEMARVARVSRGKVTYSEPGSLEMCWSAELCFVTANGQMQRLDPRTLQPTGPAIDELNRMSGGSAGFPFRTGASWGLVAPDGRFAIPPEFDLVRMTAGAVLVQRGGKWGAMSPDGRVLLSPRYEELEPAGAGAWGVKIGGRWGIARDGDDITVEPKFDGVVVAGAGLLLMEASGHRQLVTGDGRAITGPSEDWLAADVALSDFSASAWSAFTSTGELYVIDRRSLAVRRVPPPAGYAWHESTKSLPSNLRGAKIVLAEREPFPSPTRIVLLDEDGGYQPEWIFDDASRSSTVEGLGRSVDVIQVTRSGKCGFVDASTYRWVVGLLYDHCEEADGRLLVGQESD